MGRGKGLPRRRCFCRLPSCGKIFTSCREDATTCSPKCRKALNRLLGGGDGERQPANAVTEMPDGSVCRVTLNGHWVASFATRAAAEAAVAGWLREWNGEFEIMAVRPKRRWAFP